MSRSDLATNTFADLAIELSARCQDAIEGGRLDTVPNDHLGQMFASIVRVYAAKAQNGQAGMPFGRNSGITTTDVAIGCTAMLDGVGLALFELGAWQAMTSVRPAVREN